MEKNVNFSLENDLRYQNISCILLKHSNSMIAALLNRCASQELFYFKSYHFLISFLTNNHINQDYEKIFLTKVKLEILN